MKKKFINAVVYKHDEISEFIIEDGQFKEFGNDLGAADEVIDLQGRLVLPPYVDSHLHLDYYFTGQTDSAPMSRELFLKPLIFGMTLKKEQQKKK